MSATAWTHSTRLSATRALNPDRRHSDRRQRVRIGHFEVGERTLIIAEVGSNHCGDAEIARRSLVAAAECGADMVKFQLYHPEQLVEPDAPVLSYIAQTHRSQRERFRSLSLPRDLFLELAGLAREKGVQFLVTPFDEQAVEFLDPLVPAFKVASGDLTNIRLLKHIAATGKPMIVSTGFATLQEIDWLVGQMPRRQLCLLHCVGAYPTPLEQVHLAAIPFLAERYGVPVGFSDHTVGPLAALGAVAAGACVIEKHFMLSKDLQAADRVLSLDPEEFRWMVDGIRKIERMKGESGKSVQPAEQYFRTQLRRSVYAARDLQAGESLRPEDVIPLRPYVAGAWPVERIEELVGRQLARPVGKERPIAPEVLVSSPTGEGA